MSVDRISNFTVAQDLLAGLQWGGRGHKCHRLQNLHR